MITLAVGTLCSHENPTCSPMFIRPGPHGTSVLYVPSVFIGYNGEALDEKTILLRSSEILSNSAVRLLQVLGDRETKRVYATLGTEQEFFLIDRGIYNLRPDLKITGRTLIGTVPPKHQQLEDHYFGQMPSRVLAAIAEAELELYKLGVPIKTRHNEVCRNLEFQMDRIQLFIMCLSIGRSRSVRNGPHFRGSFRCRRSQLVDHGNPSPGCAPSQLEGSLPREAFRWR